jgi:hypothetical protein
MSKNQSTSGGAMVVIALGLMVIAGKLSVTGFCLWLAYKLVMHIVGG